MSLYTTQLLVQSMAKNISMNGGKTATVTPDDVTAYLNWADDYINAKLHSVYYVPLTTITRNGITNYPPPIQFIATNLAAGWLVESIYQRIEPEISDAGKVHKENAMREIDELYQGALIGSNILQGQVRKARNSFIDPNVAPLEPPNKRTYG